ncbi:MAG: SRPBCC domain-containing protein [Deltaproteobacteria bacterium]|nr:SRPBCC domain-containing protein [Deltaproteobacteria bacterium]
MRVSFVLPVSADRLYRAWLDPKEHGAFTGAGVTSTAKAGGKFSTFDGYASGKYTELVPAERIVMSWRASDFPEGAPDSRVEVLFQPASGGTRVTILHAELPPGTEEQFRKGWRRYYETPMRAHFRAAQAGAVEAETAEPAPAPKRASRVARPKAAAPRAGAPTSKRRGS